MTIRSKTISIGTSGVDTTAVFTTTPCIIEGVAIDYSASADAGTVLRAFDGTGATLFSITGNTDIGTTVAARLTGNGRLSSGTSTSNVRQGLPAFGGFSVSVTLDVAGPQVVTVYWRPARVVSEVIETVGADGSAVGGAQLVPGGTVGLFHAAHVLHGETASAGTKDLTFYNGTSTSGKALTPVANSATNWKTDAGTAANRAIATTVNRDEGLASVSDAANTYTNNGMLFNNGLHVAVAQGNAHAASVSVLAMVEL